MNSYILNKSKKGAFMKKQSIKVNLNFPILSRDTPGSVTFHGKSPHQVTALLKILKFSPTCLSNIFPSEYPYRIKKTSYRENIQGSSVLNLNICIYLFFNQLTNQLWSVPASFFSKWCLSDKQERD